MSRIINAAENLKYKAIIQTLYSGGLRLSECVNLKVHDIDSKRMVIKIKMQKGEKTAMLCCQKHYYPLYVNIGKMLIPKYDQYFSEGFYPVLSCSFWPLL
ncbi:MAG: tyrosine-type recombinase/integrase [Spirochaetales bacterium]|nr:tyrosine-type recombinase/integrase [Spirochaetales bacterium]